VLSRPLLSLALTKKHTDQLFNQDSGCAVGQCATGCMSSCYLEHDIKHTDSPRSHRAVQLRHLVEYLVMGNLITCQTVTRQAWASSGRT